MPATQDHTIITPEMSLETFTQKVLELNRQDRNINLELGDLVLEFAPELQNG